MIIISFFKDMLKYVLQHMYHFFVPNYTPYCTAWKKYVILYDETKQIKNVLYELSILFLFEKYLKIDNIF